MITLRVGDCREWLRLLPPDSVHCVVTSPPYFGLRDYGVAGQIGLEATPAAYVAEMVAVFREVKRVLRNDGVCFLNLGDSYCSAISQMRYELREDCSLEELQYVALAMFGLRIAGDEAPSERALRKVLPRRDQSRAICERSDLESERISEELFAPSINGNSKNERAKPSDENRRDQGSGREMRLLRGNDTSIFDAGSHQRGRRGSSEKNGEINHQNLSASAPGRISEAQVSYPLLQLQLRDRIMGLLSAREFTETEIPTSVRACFKTRPILKPKDLIGIPWRVAFALQADGWYLRQDIIWSKPNPMPESVRDRCTKAHEYIFLLSKSERYFFDADAIAEEAVGTPGGNVKPTKGAGQDLMRTRDRLHLLQARAREAGGYEKRNKRSVWEVATQPYSDAHFATFPPALIEPCILAGTSEKGCCIKCGAPWRRDVERGPSHYEQLGKNVGSDFARGDIDPRNQANGGGQTRTANGSVPSLRAAAATTIGWSPSCACDAAVVPCTVLDPFAGAGTTGMVADRLGRNAILIELNPAYAEMIERRIVADAGLFADVRIGS